MFRSQLCTPAEHLHSRRKWLGDVGKASAGVAAGACGFGGLLQPTIAEQLKRDQRQVLFVWLDGGLSQLESWDPKPNTEFGGPFRAIPTSVPGIHVSELLPKTARQMHHLAVVRSLCTKDDSHSAGVARIQRGDPKNRGVIYPYFGSAVAKLVGPGKSGLPPYVLIKPGSGGFVPQDAGFLGPKFGALAFGDGRPPENLTRPESISLEDDLARHALRDAADARYQRRHRPAAIEANTFVYDMAQELLKRQSLFDMQGVSPRDRQRYGEHEFGRHMLLARRMLEAGVTFVKVTSYGWDTHGDNFNGHLSLVPKFDQAFAAMIEDLAASGQLEQTLVIVLSEFGRTPRINGHVGRDHWPQAWSGVVAGRGIKPGSLVGETDARGTAVTSEPFDIGHMFHTWFKALGVDPVAAEYDNGGQPLPIAHDECHSIKEILA